MGGRGSGGHNSKGRPRDVQCARLDVHELARTGKLKHDSHGWLFGAIQFEVRGNLHSPKLLLAYPRRSASGALLQPIVQTICCHWRNARYGGRYLIFSCSECHRPARVLYARHNSTHHQIWFSPAADALVSPISPPWAIAGTARRAVLKSCAADSSGPRAVPCL